MERQRFLILEDGFSRAILEWNLFSGVKKLIKKEDTRNPMGIIIPGEHIKAGVDLEIEVRQKGVNENDHFDRWVDRQIQYSM